MPKPFVIDNSPLKEKLEALKVWALIMKRVPLATAASSGQSLTDLRECSVLGTAVGLMVLAYVAKAILVQDGLNGLTNLRKINWEKDWYGWQGNVIAGTKMVKNGTSTREGARAVLRHLELPFQGVSQ